MIMRFQCKCLILMLILFALWALPACERPDGPRQAPYPTFDPVQPFPELDAKKGGANPEGSDSFEDAINQAQEGEELPTGDENQALAQSGSYQKIPLASLFVAEVPLVFDEWQYVTDRQSTFLVHRKPGQMPDALVYVEAFSPAIENFPSYEIARFQFTVDPGLSPNSIYPPLGAMLVTGNDAGESPAFDVAMALQLAATRTMGRGLGYQSSPGSFTGWKWVGHTPYGMDIRLGRSQGRWEEQRLPVGAIVKQILGQYGAQYPELQQLAEQFNQLSQTQTTRSPGAAWMVVGSITRQSNLSMGVHIAMVCEQKPVCPVSKELAHLLESIRGLDDAGLLAAPASDNYVEFTSQAGVELLGMGEQVNAADMMRILNQPPPTEELSE